MSDHIEHACPRCGSYLCREQCPAAEAHERRNALTRPQPPPKDAEGDVWRLVVADMEARRQFGIAKYGKPLGVENGRDPMIDAYQEVLDLAVYLRQAIERRKVAP